MQRNAFRLFLVGQIRKYTHRGLNIAPGCMSGIHYSGTRTVSGVVWNDMQIRVSRGKLGAIIGTKYGYSISISAYRMENAIKYVDIEYERYSLSSIISLLQLCDESLFYIISRCLIFILEKKDERDYTVRNFLEQHYFFHYDFESSMQFCFFFPLV